LRPPGRVAYQIPVFSLARLRGIAGRRSTRELKALLQAAEAHANVASVRSFLQQNRDRFSATQRAVIDDYLAASASLSPQRPIAAAPARGSPKGKANLGWDASVEATLHDAFSDPLIGGQFHAPHELGAAHSEARELSAVGERRFAAWLSALAYLDAIPIGELKPTRQLIDQLHTILSSYEEPHFWNPLRFLPKGFSRFNGGAPRWYPTLQLQNRHTDAEPLTDEELAAMRSLPRAPAYIELPWSRPGHRRVIHLYRGWGLKVRQELDALQRFYEANAGKLDPVELAVDWAQRFVRLHPYNDSVGKITRLVANRILNEFGLPPALLDTFDELVVSREQLVKEYRRGIARYRELAGGD
jgi:hypothetical protein